MSWKYHQNKNQIKQYREQIQYVPFTYRNETHCSPFYHFEKKNNTDSQQIKTVEFQNDEIFQNEGHRLKMAVDPLDNSVSHRSGKSFSSDSEGNLNENIQLTFLNDYELKSEEFLEIQKRVNAQGRRQAIFQPYQFGLQLEDIFNNNLSSIAKNLNEDERSPGKTSFQFNNIRSGLLDEMGQVKDMIDSHIDQQSVLNQNESLEQNQNEQNKGRKNKKNLNINNSNINNSNINNTSKQSKQSVDLQIKGVSPKKGSENQEEKKLFKSTKVDQQISISNQENNEYLESQNLNEYLNQVILQRGNNKKKGLRQLFIFYKKFKGNFYSVQIERFFVPVYSQIVDNLELIQDFLYWKDYLSKWMKMRGKQIENIFTSNGFRIMNLNQIHHLENIIIIQDEDDTLQFWHDFQIYHNIQLTIQEQRYFVDHLNNLQSKDEVYKSLISQTLMNKILQGYNSEKNQSMSQNNQSSIQKITQEKGFSLPSIHKKEFQPENPNQSYQNAINANQTQQKKQNRNMHTRYSSSVIDFKPQMQQLQKERLELVDLFSQYENIMISSISRKMKNPNKISSISQGALRKQFNGVKMKVLQQSFPYLAQKKYIEAKLLNSTYKTPQFSSEKQQDSIDFKI